MLAIYRKEMTSYFINPIGYVYLGIFLVFSALLCCYTTIVSGTYSTNNYFFYLILSFIILLPLLTMRLFAEDRKMRSGLHALQPIECVRRLHFTKINAASAVGYTNRTAYLIAAAHFLLLNGIYGAEKYCRADRFTKLR